MPPVVTQGCAGVEWAATVPEVDLRTWLSDAHRDARARLSGAVTDRVPRERWSEQADGGGSSLTWLLLHTARHHDLALQTAICNRVPLFADHRHALGLSPTDHDPAAGIGLTEREDPVATTQIDNAALLDYLNAVLDAGDAWISQLSTLALDTVVDSRQRLTELAGLPTDEFGWLLDMWTNKPVHWLVQWPILGHLQSHLGEAISVRNRLGYSPF